MKFIFSTLITLLLMMSSLQTFAADRYFKTGATTWSSASSWSATSASGIDNAGIPTTNDNVIIGNSSSNITVNQNAECLGIILQPTFTGTLNLTYYCYLFNIGVNGFQILGGNVNATGSSYNFIKVNGTFTLNGSSSNFSIYNFTLEVKNFITIAGLITSSVNSNIKILVSASVANNTIANQDNSFEFLGSNINNVMGKFNNLKVTTTSSQVIINDVTLSENPGSYPQITGNLNFGSASIVNNLVVFDCPANQFNLSSFSYTITNNQNEVIKSVGVDIRKTSAPIATVDSITVNEDSSAYRFYPLNNDTNSNGSFSISGVSTPLKGNVTFGPNSIDFTPLANQNGSDVFTYTITTTYGLTAVGTVNVMITNVNDIPVAVNDSFTTNEDAVYIFNPTTNDVDIDGNTLNIIAKTNGAKGTVSYTGNTVTYTPNANVNGNDSFTYTISDGIGGTAVGTVNVTITAVNDAPVAVTDSFTRNEDSAYSFNPTTNDTDVEYNTISVIATTNGSKGTVTRSGNNVTYTPNLNANGSDSFTYTISDGNGGTAVGTVNVTITPINDMPVAVTDSFATNEDTAYSFNPTTNDTDVDADTLTITAKTNGTKGIVSYSGNTVTYTPNENANGSDSFTYTISDNNGGTSVGSVNVTITAVNDAPVAVADSFTRNEDTAYSFNPTINDTDVEGNALTIIAKTNGAKGTVSYTGNTVTYTPNANANGSDSFNYTISDGNGGTAVGTVNVTITPVNDAPIAVTDNFTINEDTAYNFNPTTNDTDVEGNSLSITSKTDGAKGSVSYSGNTITYAPNLNANGSDSFTYTISDGNGGTAVGTVNVTITPVNDAPVAVTDSFTINEDTAYNFSPTTNDTDVEGNALTITAKTNGSKGIVSYTGNTVTYTPNANANGSDSFTYTISDGNGGTAVGTVNVTITPVNDAPVAVTDNFTTNEDTAYNFNPTINDTDVEGDTLTITAKTDGTNGSVSYAGNTITYTPNLNANGSDSFTYTISDGNGGTAVGTVSVTITPVNDAPIAIADSYAAYATVPIMFDVITNDSDIDSSTLTVTAVATPSHGTAVIQSNQILYTGNAGYSGNDSFGYTISDGQATASTSVSVVVMSGTPTVNVNVPAGTYNNYKYVTMTPVNISGGTLRVHYTTNGTTPTTSSAYVDASSEFKILVNQDCTLKAFATNGTVSSIVYTQNYSFVKIAFARNPGKLGGGKLVANIPCYYLQGGTDAFPDSFYGIDTDRFDSNPNLTRMNVITVEFADILEAGTLAVAKGPTILYSTPVVPGQNLGEINIDMTTYLGQSDLQIYLDTTDILENKYLFPLMIDRSNLFAYDTADAHPNLIGSTDCNEQFSTSDFDMYFFGGISPTVNAEGVQDIVHVFDNDKEMPLFANLNWEYYSSLYQIPQKEFSFAVYTFDTAGNGKLELGGICPWPQSVPRVYRNVSYNQSLDGYQIVTEETDNCGDNVISNIFPSSTTYLKPSEFHAIYDDWGADPAEGDCYADNAFEITSQGSGGNVSIWGELIYHIDYGCVEKEEFKLPGIKDVSVTNCQVTASFVNLGDDSILDEVVKVFEPQDVQVSPTSSEAPIIGENTITHLFKESKLFTSVSATVTECVPGFNLWELDEQTKSKQIANGIVEKLVFSKCDISFDTKTQISGGDLSDDGVTVTVVVPNNIRLDLINDGSSYNRKIESWSQNGNTYTIYLQLDSSYEVSSFNLKYTNIGGDVLTCQDKVTVTLNLEGCNNSEDTNYNDKACSCKTDSNSPHLFAKNPIPGSNLFTTPRFSLQSGQPNPPGTTYPSDPEQPVDSMVFDGDDRVTLVLFKDGGTTQFIYNDQEKTVTEINQEGTTVLFQYDSTFTSVIQKTIVGGSKGYSFAYTPNGDISKVGVLKKDSNGVYVEQYATNYEFDGNNNVTKRIDPDGTFETWSQSSSQYSHTNKFGVTTTTTLDAQGRVASVSNNTGTTVYTYGLVIKKVPNIIKVEFFGAANQVYDPLIGTYSGSTYDSYSKSVNTTTYTITEDTIERDNTVLFTRMSIIDPAEPFDDAVYIATDGTRLITKLVKVERLLKIKNYNPEGQLVRYQKKLYDIGAYLMGYENRLTDSDSEAPYYKEIPNQFNYNGIPQSITYLRESEVKGIAIPTEQYTNGYLTSITNPDLGVISYVYHTTEGQKDLIFSETDALGNTIYHVFDNMRRETLTYGATSRPGVSTYSDGGNLLTFECKQYDPILETFGPTHYKEIYNYMGTLLLSKRIEDATGTQFVVESYTYDFLGRRETVTDANGVVTKYFYNSMDSVTQEIRDFGISPNNLNITTNYTYNAKGQLEDTSIEGKTTRNLYDSFGRLTSVVQDPLGLNITQVSYTYDSQWRQKTMTDAMGGVTTFNYTQLGQQFQTVNALGVVSESVFDGAGNVIRRIEDAGTNKLNATTEFFFDIQGRQYITISGVDEAYEREDRVEFDLNGNIVKQIEDFGLSKLNRTTVFEFDSLGNQTKVTLDPDATSYTGLKIINQSTYNEIGQLTSTTAPNDLVTEYHYNYLGRQTSTVVDPSGLAITNSTIYDPNGNVTQTTDAGGLIVTVVYDALSRAGTQTVDPGGKNIVSKTFYNRDGTIDRTINPEGVVTKNNYNILGQRENTIVDFGVTNITTQFEYNLVGNITTIIDPLTKTATRGYDALHRSIASTDAKGNISRVVYDNLNRPVTSIDALGVQTVINYNLLNQVTSQTVDPTGLNQTSSMEYDSLGRTTKVIKANTVQEVFEYDLADRKTKAIEDPTSLNIITQYEYNSLSQMTKVIDAKNKATQYGYNYLGQLETETFADTGVKTYTYNSIGQRETQTDQNNNQFEYLYDNLYRLTTVNVNPGLGVGGTTQQVFVYDNMSRLTNAKDIAGTTNEIIRDYNTLGRLEIEIQKIGTTTERTIAKQYNLVGRVSQLTYPNGRINSYTFDDNHLPYTTTSNSTLVASYTFNAVNASVTKTLGNNVSLNIEYNNRYQIKKHVWKLNGNTITGFNYGHDSVGNRLYSENLVTANKSELFAFDNADRLTSFKTGTLNGAKDNIVAPTYSQSWNLDAIGNWAGFTDNGTSSTNTFSDTHEMTQFKGITNTFDNNGNLTSDGIRSFKYDAFNRIIQVKVGVVVLAEYQYDAFNRRVMKKVDADLNSSFETTVKFLYDDFRCIEELNGSDALTKEYVYGSLYIDEVILQRTGATDYYFIHDYRYSVTSLTNSTGNIVESYDYKVYGERTCSSTGLTDVGYTGQRHDSETGLMYFKNRYYSTSMGQFVTKDPKEYIDGMSMYLGYFAGMGTDAFGFKKAKYIEAAGYKKYIPFVSAELTWELEERELDVLAEISLEILILEELLRIGLEECSKDEGGDINADRIEINKQIAELNTIAQNILEYTPPASRPAQGATMSYLDDIGILQSLLIETFNPESLALSAGGLILGKHVKKLWDVKKVKTHGHHTFPVFLGGPKVQWLAKLTVKAHQKLHSELNTFLKGKTKEIFEKGKVVIKDMYARKGNPGKIIREIFTREERGKAMAEFYKGAGKKYKKAAELFFKQFPEFK